jgi:hypothetical protein
MISIYFITDAREYFSTDSATCINRENALIFEKIILGHQIYKFKTVAENKYLAYKSGNIYFTKKNDKYTLFHVETQFNEEIIEYILINGQKFYIHVISESISPQYDSQVFNGTIANIHPEFDLIEKYQKDGIIFWEHYYWDDNLFETLKDKILSESVDDIFLFFFFHNFIMKSCISTSLKGMLGRIFPNGYHLTDHSFNKISYDKILPVCDTEILKVQVIFALDDLIISYKTQSFLSYDTFFEETINIPKGNIVLLCRNLWYRILSSSTFLIANYSSM